MQQVKRVSFSLRKSSYAELIERIRVGVSSLGQLTITSIELEPERQVRSQGRLLRLVRDTSKSIYRALKGSLTCHGVHDHDLNLGLAVRSAEFGPNDDDEKICSQFKFNIAISTHSDGQSASPPMKTWDEVEVKEAAVASIASSIPTESLSPNTSSSQKGKGKAVSFGSFDSSCAPSSRRVEIRSTTVTATTTTTNTSANTPSSPPQQLSVAEAMSGIQETVPPNLCQSLYKARRQLGSYCGCVTDTEISKAPREYRISLTTSSETAVTTAPTTPGILSTLSLRQVLENRTKDLPPLTFNDRLYLAAVISSSVLQLHRTPWLADIVSSEDIMFIQRGNTISYRHAFVKRQPDNQAAAGSSSDMGFTPRNPMVLSLGILLVEIILGKPVHNGKRDSGQHDLLSNYAAAYKLLHEVDLKGSQNYGSAVRRCLSYHIPTDSQDMEDERFRHDVYRTIVALLERDLSYIGMF